jgi:hypothetical protein
MDSFGLPPLYSTSTPPSFCFNATQIGNETGLHVGARPLVFAGVLEVECAVLCHAAWSVVCGC